MKRLQRANSDEDGKKSKRVLFQSENSLPPTDPGFDSDNEEPAGRSPSWTKKNSNPEDKSDDVESEHIEGSQWHKVGEQTYAKSDLDRLDAEELDPFDLSEERTMGNFDASGSFTWKRRDLDEEEDEAWLSQVGDQIARKTRSPASEPKTNSISVDKPSVLLCKAIDILKPNETTLDALKRLRADKANFSVLTDASAILMQEGMLDIYSLSREDLVKRIRPVEWRYRVEMEETIHGPFSGEDMQQWRQEGFFTADSEQHCVVQIVGKSEWIPAANILSFRLDPDLSTGL